MVASAFAVPPEKRGKRALTYGERLELDALPAKIEAHDAHPGALDARLADPVTYTDGSDVAALVRALDEARAEGTRLLARWEELELKREAGEG